MHDVAVRARQQAVLGGGQPLRRQQTLLPPPVGHGEDGGHVGVVEVGVGGDGRGVAVGDDVRLRGAAVVVVVVLHRRRVALSSSTATTVVVVTPPLRLARFGWDSAEKGQDLQGALGDGGQLGEALLVAGDVVDVVAEEAAVALQRQREAVMEEEEEDGGTGNILASRKQLHTCIYANDGENKVHINAFKPQFPTTTSC